MEKRIKISIEASDLKIPPAAVAHNFGGRRYRINPKVRRRIEEAIAAARTLVEPAAVFGLHPVKTVTSKGQLVLENGLKLRLPCSTERKEVNCLSAGLATLGRHLEQTCREFSARGEIYNATLLDAVGTCLLEALADICRQQLAEEARKKNSYYALQFSPGLNGCDLNQQSFLFRLVDAPSIGVALSPDYIMTPIKSVSMFSLFTSEPAETGRYKKCRHCELKDCQFRIA